MLSETKLQERELLNRALGLVKEIILSVNRQIDARLKEIRLAEIYDRLDPKSLAIYRGNKFKVRICTMFVCEPTLMPHVLECFKLNYR